MDQQQYSGVAGTVGTEYTCYMRSPVVLDWVPEDVCCLLIDILVLPAQSLHRSLAAECQEAHLLGWAAVAPFQEVRC